MFISHATEDKPFVRELASAFEAEGVSVWLDELKIGWGQSLSKSIDKGLASSRYGIVVLSEAFFRKQWPLRELQGLVQRQMGEGRDIILPIFHGVTPEEVRRFSPPLADALALDSADGVGFIVARFKSLDESQGMPASASEQVDKPNLVGPNPSLELADGGSKLLWSNPVVAITEEAFVSDRMAALRKSSPQLRYERSPFRVGLPGESPEEIRKYNQQLEAYYIKSEEYLKRAYRYELEAHLMPCIVLRALNTGTSMATHLRATLRLGEECRFWNPNDVPVEEDPPSTPRSPTSWLTKGRRLDEFEWPENNGSGEQQFVISKDGRVAWYEVPNLVQHAPCDLPTVLIASKVGTAVTECLVAWELTCAEIPQPIRGDIEVSTVDTPGNGKPDNLAEWLHRRYETRMEELKRIDPELWKDE